MEITKGVADFVAGIQFSDIPEAARELGKRAMLDCLGVALAGSKDPTSEILVDLLEEMGGQPQASVWGKGFRTSSPLAALANGTFGHALDYDDTNLSMRGHPSVPVLPAVLAVGEEKRASGQEVLGAYLIGLEVETKLGKVLSANLFKCGWHATGVLGVLGAAAAVSRLLKMDSEKIRHALGIASSASAGLRQNFGTMTKPYHAGQSAKNGMLAAKLAERGFTAAVNIIESHPGFVDAFAGQGNYDLNQIPARLGQPFDVVSPGLGIKQFPSCARTHPAIDAMLEIVLKEEIRPEEVESISCGGSYTTPQMLIHSRPQTGLEGKFSMQFCLAIALLERKVALSQFTDKKVQSPKVQEMIRKVNFYVRPDLQNFENAGNHSATVTVVMRDGKKYEKQVDEAKGTPGNPLPPNFVEEKYRDCARTVQTEEEVAKTIELIENLESLKDVSALTSLLRCAEAVR